MHRRFCLALLLAAYLVTAGSAFAPAPIFREPPKPKVAEILAAMQGTWDVIRPKNGPVRVGRSMRIRFEGKTWTYVYTTNGVERVGATYEIVLDPKHSPPTMDLKHPATANRVGLPGGGQLAPFVMTGIVKVEGDTLTYCYVSGISPNATRPSQFTLRQAMPNGDRAKIFTLTRVK